MTIPRRELMSATASLGAVAALAPSQALAMTSRLMQGANDPLGVRQDFPILENGRSYLNSAYITPCPRAVAAAGAAFVQAYGFCGVLRRRNQHAMAAGCPTVCAGVTFGSWTESSPPCTD